MTTTITQDQAATRLPARDRRVIITLLVATFVMILNETIMGVALPRLMTELSISANTVQWLSTAFMLTMAVVIPTTGFLLERLSTRTVFMLAMSLFATGTALAAVSPGFWLLLPARIVQASGTAMMLPLLMTTVLTLVPIEQRGMVMGNISIAISVAPAIGPTLSGLVLQYLSWRFMFIVVLPIALVALVYGSRRLTNVGESGHQSLDVLSVALSVPAFGGIVYGLSRFTGQGTGIGVAMGILAFGLVCLFLFGWRQRVLQSNGDPLLDLRAFSFPMFRLSVAVLCIAMLALFGSVILLPIYLQDIRGLSSLQTGLLLLPGGLLMGLLGPAVGKIFDRFGPKALTVTGAVMLSVAMWRFSTVDAATPVWLLLGIHVLTMMSLALLFTPCFTTGLNPLPPHLYSHGSAIMTTLQQVAGAAGTAALVVVMTARSGSLVAQGLPAMPALNGGISSAFLVATAIAVVAIACAAFLRSPKPEAEIE